MFIKLHKSHVRMDIKFSTQPWDVLCLKTDSFSNLKDKFSGVFVPGGLLPESNVGNTEIHTKLTQRKSNTVNV